MDLTFLDKSSSVTPLLVRLYDSHKLYKLAKDKKPFARAELTSAVTALLDMNLSGRESELIADILIALMRQAEKDLRQALAEKLSISDKVPLRLVLQISNDEIDVAAPILRNSPVLGDLDLIYIIKSKTAEHWREIARRKALSDHVMNVLSDTHDLETALNLIENKNIKLASHTLSVLSDIAQGNETISSPLLHRSEITNELAGKLYKFVGMEMKRYILDHYQVKTDLLIEAIDDIVLELADAAESNEFTPSSALINDAERFKSKGLLTPHLMIQTLKRNQTQAFIAQFSKFTGLSVDTVLSILRQTSGQGLAIACKAFEFEKQDFISLFLLTNRIRNNGKMVDIKDITRAVTYFERTQQNIAKDIIKNSLSDNIAD